MNPADVMSHLRDIQMELTVRYDPASQELKRATAAMMDRIKTGELSAQDARGQLAAFHARRSPAAYGSTLGSSTNARRSNNAKTTANTNESESRQNLISRATTLCKQVSVAFPEDATSLGCSDVNTEYEAETVINTVCDRIRWSVPSVTPEQFNCPVRI